MARAMSHLQQLPRNRPLLTGILQREIGVHPTLLSLLAAAELPLRSDRRILRLLTATRPALHIIIDAVPATVQVVLLILAAVDFSTHICILSYLNLNITGKLRFVLLLLITILFLTLIVIP